MNILKSFLIDNEECGVSSSRKVLILSESTVIIALSKLNHLYTSYMARKGKGFLANLFFHAKTWACGYIERVRIVMMMRRMKVITKERRIYYRKERARLAVLFRQSKGEQSFTSR